MLAFAIFYPLGIRGLDPHHDGLMLKSAWDVAHGQVLFRDTFTQYGPLTTYLHALSLQWFGESLYSLRLLSVLALAACAGLLVKLWGLLLPRRLVWLSIGFWLLLSPDFISYWTFLPWSSVLALPFQIGAALFWILAVGRPERAAFYGVLAGLFAASVFWLRTPVGIVLAGVILGVEVLLSLLHSSGPAGGRRRFFSILGGMAVFHAFFGLLLARQGTLEGWFEYCIFTPMHWAQGRGAGLAHMLKLLFMVQSDFFVDTQRDFPVLRRAVALTAFGCLLFLPFAGERINRRRSVPAKAWVAVAVILLGVSAGLDWELFRDSPGWAFWLPLIWIFGGAFLVAHAKTRPARMSLLESAPFMLLTVTLGSWLQYYPINCPRHVFWSATPGIGLAVFLLARAFGGKTRYALATLLLLLTPLLASRADQFIKKSRRLAQPVAAGALQGIRLSAPEIEQLNRVDALFAGLFAKRPDVPILIEGPDALFAVWPKNLLNFRPQFVIWMKGDAYELSDEDKTRRERFIREKSPLILVILEPDPEIHQLMDAGGYRKVSGLGAELGDLYANF